MLTPSIEAILAVIAGRYQPILDEDGDLVSLRCACGMVLKLASLPRHPQSQKHKKALAELRTEVVRTLAAEAERRVTPRRSEHENEAVIEELKAEIAALRVEIRELRRTL